MSDSDSIKLNGSDLNDILIKQLSEKYDDAVYGEIIYKSPSSIQIGREKLIEMLKRENEIRLMYETKAKFDSFNEDMALYRIYDEQISIQTLKDFGYSHDSDDSLKAYRLACGKYLYEKEIRELIVWMKYDKTRMGKLKVGDQVITEGIYVYDLEGNKKELRDLIFKDKINVVVGGSMT
jgi:hypothetical protein